MATSHYCLFSPVAVHTFHLLCKMGTRSYNRRKSKRRARVGQRACLSKIVSSHEVKQVSAIEYSSFSKCTIPISYLTDLRTFIAVSGTMDSHITVQYTVRSCVRPSVPYAPCQELSKTN